MLYLDSRSFVRPFSPDDLNLLTVLANVAATRVEQERMRIVEESERRIQRDLTQAAEIQSLFLPRTAPRYAGLDVAGFNAACRTVGGDYYDFVPAPDGRLAVALGDVSGKGLPAALVMTSLQGMVQALAVQSDDLGNVMGALDRFVAARCPSNRFVSLFYALLDPASGGIVYCNAGHNPPLLVRADGSVERLAVCGTVLGILPEIGYSERRTSLEPGDALVVYSDGVTEATSPDDEEFGDGRLAELLCTLRTKPAADIVVDVERAVSAWTHGAPPTDDLTLVVVRRTGAGA
jgi:serine phosphatase RsbU (regulator of sigma subunit)